MKEVSHKRTNIVCLHLHGVARVIKFLNTKSRMVVARAWEEWEDEKLLYNGYTALIWEDKKSSANGDGDGCSTVWMYLLPVNCAYKNKVAYFDIYIFP